LTTRNRRQNRPPIKKHIQPDCDSLSCLVCFLSRRVAYQKLAGQSASPGPRDNQLVTLPHSSYHPGLSPHLALSRYHA
jgi:hypothetical protein